MISINQESSSGLTSNAHGRSMSFNWSLTTTAKDLLNLLSIKIQEEWLEFRLFQKEKVWDLRTEFLFTIHTEVSDRQS
jgi:hypothetical protein